LDIILLGVMLVPITNISINSFLIVTKIKYLILEPDDVNTNMCKGVKFTNTVITEQKSFRKLVTHIHCFSKKVHPFCFCDLTQSNVDRF